MVHLSQAVRLGLVAAAAGLPLGTAFLPPAGTAAAFRPAAGAHAEVLTAPRLRPVPPCTRTRRPTLARLRAAATAADLDTWLAEQGGKTACTATPAGLVAQRDLKPGDEACSVSLKACLTAASARAAFGALADTVDAETAIALQLLLEQSKGASSVWAAWISTLPARDALGTPYFWPKGDQELLQGTSVLDAIEENAEAYQEEFDQLQAQGWADKFPAGVLTRESYEWAVELVAARAVVADKVEGSYILAPFVDAAFTAPPGSGTAEFYLNGMLREPRVRVVAGAGGVKQGDVVRLDFGGKSISKMLLRHGVADPNGQSAYDVQFSVSPMDKYRDDKLDILEINGMEEDLSIAFSAEDYLTADETAFLRLVCLEGMDAFLLESVFRNEVWGFMQEPVSRDNEQRMLDTLIATCEGALSAFQTSDAEDRKALAADSSRGKYAAAVRLSEKAALKNTILILEEELEDLDDKEYYQERRLRLLNLDRPLDESEIIDPDVDIRRENIPGM